MPHTKEQRIAIANEQGNSRQVAARHGLHAVTVRTWRSRYREFTSDAHAYATLHPATLPIIKLMFAEVIKQNVSLARVAKRAGLGYATVYRMFYYGKPGMAINVMSVANALGFDVVLQRNEQLTQLHMKGNKRGYRYRRSNIEGDAPAT